MKNHRAAKRNQTNKYQERLTGVPSRSLLFDGCLPMRLHRQGNHIESPARLHAVIRCAASLPRSTASSTATRMGTPWMRRTTKNNTKFFATCESTPQSSSTVVIYWGSCVTAEYAIDLSTNYIFA